MGFIERLDIQQVQLCIDFGDDDGRGNLKGVRNKVGATFFLPFLAKLGDRFLAIELFAVFDARDEIAVGDAFHVKDQITGFNRFRHGD